MVPFGKLNSYGGMAKKIRMFQGKVGLVAGWGKTDNSFGKTGTNILHKVLVPVINNEECIRWHEDKNIMVQVGH
jgi:hypothetical protein